MNYSDSERIDTVFQNLGLSKTDKMDEADLIIFNTCSVRQKAEDRVFGQMRKISKFRRERPNLLVGITGCMVRKTSTRSFNDRDSLIKRMKELDMTFRIEDLPKIPDMLHELWSDYKFPEIAEANLKNYFQINPIYTNSFQAFVPIGTGCDNFCTYCIVPYSRKREKSRPMDDIWQECEKLVENGCLEITLLGQNVNSYGISNLDKKTDEFKNIEHPFVRLLERIDELKEKGLKRLRFTSNHPKDLSDELIDAMGLLDTLMPYLHLPVQSGNDDVLKHMNRHYSADWYKNLIKKLRKTVPGISISTDIIVGFCGETEEQFMDTYRLFEEVQWDMAYLAQYSTRLGTFADRNLVDDIMQDVKKKRWHRLNDLLTGVAREKNKIFEGKIVEVLVEKYEGGKCEGRSEHFKTVIFPSEKDLTGQLKKVKVIKGREWLLEGEMV
jgi:tRNA-2-methylthio-N6-dimethylallyladenosine synthase